MSSMYRFKLANTLVLVTLDKGIGYLYWGVRSITGAR